MTVTEAHHRPAFRDAVSLWVCYLSLFPSVIWRPLEEVKLISPANIIGATLENSHRLKGN